MEIKHKVCVVIPSFNTKDMTIKLINQLQEVKSVDLITVILENNSEDGTRDSLLKINVENFHLIINSENLGFTKAINQGISKGLEFGADYFCLMNTDVDITNLDAFKVMCDTLDEYQSFGILAPDNTVIGRNRQERMTWINEDVGFADEGMWYTVMLPRKTIEDVGLLDEQFFLHCSDSEYSTRLRYCGYKYGIIKLDKVGFKHTGFASSRKLPGVSKIIKQDGALWYEKSNGTLQGKPIHDPFFPKLTRERRVKEPFLTVITRHWVRRPTFITQNKESVAKVIPSGDAQHLLIVDDTQEGKGLEWAGKAFEEYKYKLNIQGSYVLILDDDNIIIDEHITTKLRKAAIDNNFPEALVFKSIINDKVYPPNLQWTRKQLQSCKIGSFCYAVTKEFFMENAAVFGEHFILGDFKFIKKVEHLKKRVVWVEDLTACKTIRESNGRPE